MLVKVVALARIENEIDVLIEKRLDVSVHEFCGIACRIGCHRMLTAEVQLARAAVGEYDFKAARLKELRPERELFKHDKLNGKSHSCARIDCLLRKRKQFFVFIGVDIGQIAADRQSRTALTLVPRDKPSAVRKGENIDVAVRSTALADNRA